MESSELSQAGILKKWAASAPAPGDVQAVKQAEAVEAQQRVAQAPERMAAAPRAAKFHLH